MPDLIGLLITGAALGLAYSAVPGAVNAREVEHNIALMRHAIPAAFWAELKDKKLLPSHCPVPP